MIYGQHNGTKVMIAPVAVATNADSFGYIDTKGYNYLEVTFVLDTAATTSNNPATLKLGESDDTVTTNFSDITESVGDTAFTIPDGDTSNPTTLRMNVDLLGKKRYIGATLKNGTATTLACVVGTLSRAESGTNARALHSATVDM